MSLVPLGFDHDISVILHSFSPCYLLSHMTGKNESFYRHKSVCSSPKNTQYYFIHQLSSACRVQRDRSTERCMLYELFYTKKNQSICRKVSLGVKFNGSCRFNWSLNFSAFLRPPTWKSVFELWFEFSFRKLNIASERVHKHLFMLKAEAWPSHSYQKSQVQGAQYILNEGTNVRGSW